MTSTPSTRLCAHFVSPAVVLYVPSTRRSQRSNDILLATLFFFRAPRHRLLRSLPLIIMNSNDGRPMSDWQPPSASAPVTAGALTPAQVPSCYKTSSHSAVHSRASACRAAPRNPAPACPHARPCHRARTRWLTGFPGRSRPPRATAPLLRGTATEIISRQLPMPAVRVVAPRLRSDPPRERPPAAAARLRSTVPGDARCH